METNVVILGDCLDVLRELPDNSIDSVVTDPPYGLSKEPNIEEVLTKWLAGEDYTHRTGAVHLARSVSCFETWRSCVGVCRDTDAGLDDD